MIILVTIGEPIPKIDNDQRYMRCFNLGLNFSENGNKVLWITDSFNHQKKIQRDTTYILKYTKNDFSRIHVDDLRGDVDRVDISILFYLCDQWIWDWGGILMLAESTKSEDMISIMPKNNRLVLINNQMKLPHCVTPVANYAKNDRFAIASFIGCDTPFK